MQKYRVWNVSNFTNNKHYYQNLDFIVDTYIPPGYWDTVVWTDRHGQIYNNFTTETVDSLTVEICIFFTKVTANFLSDPSYLSVNECFLNRYYYTVFPYTLQILSCGFIYVQNNIYIQKSVLYPQSVDKTTIYVCK